MDAAASYRACSSRSSVFRMTPDVAKALLVAKVLVGDGMMQDEERVFLDAVMDGLGLGADERVQVFELEGMDRAHEIVLALPKDERQKVLEMLVDAAAADGKLSPHELAVVKRLTETLQL